jgi:hypothetical protein
MVDSRIEKWRRWLDEAITPDVHDIYLHRATYKRVQEIVVANERLPRDSYFWEYLEDTYATTQAVAVRRQAEPSTRVRSLGQLIKEVAENAQHVTRDFFVGMWVDPDDRDEIRRMGWTQIATSTWDEKFGGSVGEHLDPTIPLADLAALTETAASLKAFVDERIAHSDRRPRSPLPTFEDLDAAVDQIGELVVKYYLLFTAAGLVDLVPALQTDWEAVFRQPWISTREGPDLHEVRDRGADPANAEGGGARDPQRSVFRERGVELPRHVGRHFVVQPVEWSRRALFKLVHAVHQRVHRLALLVAL